MCIEESVTCVNCIEKQNKTKENKTKWNVSKSCLPINWSQTKYIEIKQKPNIFRLVSAAADNDICSEDTTDIYIYYIVYSPQY